MKRFILLFLSGVLLVAACAPGALPAARSLPTLTPQPPATVTPTPFLPAVMLSPSPTYVPAPKPEQATPAPLESPPRLWLDPRLPAALRVRAAALDAAFVQQAAEADFQLTFASTSADPVRWVYALVAPFSTLRDDVSADDVRSWWRNGGQTLFVSEAAADGFTLLWGAPSDAVHSRPSDLAVLEEVRRGAGWGLVAFENLIPQVKTLTVDGDSPLHNDFSAEKWPLTLTFGFSAPAPVWRAALPDANRQAEHLTVLVMTGVTALVRATADRMEKKGLLYPARDIGAWLRNADVTHISNEIPFFDRCPPPNPMQGNLVFCSSPRYIALLEDVGTDVVELTGNHFQDYGSEATLQTLDMYDARSWPYYGGGRDLEDAMQPALIEDHGNRLAFIGCNPVGPDFAWAASGRPGAAPCNDYTWMEAAIRALKAQGYFVVATFQYQEYYVMRPPENQVLDFGRMAEAGADIISGSQSHFPQGMVFWGDTFIHYGLGNLFFDQMDIPVAGTRRAFIDRYAIYEGRLMGVELLTTLLEDYARPRPMTADERAALLRDAFAAADWPVYP